MAKRFSSTDKWDDMWFFELSNEAKLFWLYILDKCDHAGIWQVNMPIATAYLKFVPSLDMVSEKVVVLSSQKWFIPKFIQFQYGELSPGNRMHQSVITVLKKEGAYKPLGSPLEGAKDKEQDKDKVKEKITNNINIRWRKPKLEDVVKYCKETNSPIDPEYFWNNYESTGWIKANGQPVKNWKATIKTWEGRDGKRKECVGASRKPL